MIHQSVLDAWHAFSEPLEGRVLHMYLDVKGLVTTGVGNLIDPVVHATRLPWKRLDGSLATKAEITSEWQWLKKQQGLAKKHYHYAGAVTTLRLTDADVDSLVASKLASNATELAKHFPEFASFPADAQLGILSMAWAMGPAFALKFPTFTRLANAQQWVKASQACGINADGNPGVIPRNQLNAAHFIAAASYPPSVYPHLLFGPCRLDVLKAGWIPPTDPPPTLLT